MSQELPKGWITTSLDKLLVAFESGSRPRGGVHGIDQGIPSIGGEHLSYNGAFDFSSVKYVPKAFSDQMNKGWILSNDILVVKDGATTGKTAFVGTDFPFLEAVVNEHVFICRPSPEIDPRFLFRYLISKEGQDRVLANFKGSAQGGINQTFAPNTEVPLAPLNEQRQIVQKLEKLLGKVDACQQRLEKIPVILKRFRQSVLAAAYSGRLTADWRARNSPPAETGHAFLQRIKKERQLRVTTGRRGFSYGSEPFLPESVNLPKIPNTWAWSSLAEIGEIVTGKTPSKKNPRYWNGEIPFVMPGDLAKAEDCLSLKEIICTNNLVTEEGFNAVQHLVSPAVFVCCIGTLGRVGIIRGRAAFSQQLNAIIPQSDMCLEYVAFYCHTIEPILKELWPRNTYMPIVNKTLFSSVPIPVPPVAEQEVLVKELKKRLFEQRTMEINGEKAHAQIARLNQSILAKAFRGELVPQDPNDEPACVLLERIKAERTKGETEQKGRGKKRLNVNRKGKGR